MKTPGFNTHVEMTEHHHQSLLPSMCVACAGPATSEHPIWAEGSANDGSGWQVKMEFRLCDACAEAVELVHHTPVWRRWKLPKDQTRRANAADHAVTIREISVGGLTLHGSSGLESIPKTTTWLRFTNETYAKAFASVQHHGDETVFTDEEMDYRPA